jgi:hypothetical protein
MIIQNGCIKSVKLTNGVKQQIVNAVLADVLKTQKGELMEMGHALADAAYTEIYGAMLQTMESLPYNAFCRSAGITVKFNGRNSGFLPFRAESDGSSSARPFFYNEQHNFSAEHKLTARFIEYTTAKEAYASNKYDKGRELRELLGSVTTSKRLSEAWPEGAVYYDPIINKKISECLPAVPSDVLNSRFNAVLCK